jgi:predicted nuclease with TOPRIM domain
MRTQLEERLKQLKAEYEAGQKMLADLEARQASLRETMLRISGAIQVLEEELAKTEEAPPQTHAPDDSPGSAVKIIAQ